MLFNNRSYDGCWDSINFGIILWVSFCCFCHESYWSWLECWELWGRRVEPEPKILSPPFFCVANIIIVTITITTIITILVLLSPSPHYLWCCHHHRHHCHPHHITSVIIKTTTTAITTLLMRLPPPTLSPPPPFLYEILMITHES